MKQANDLADSNLYRRFLAVNLWCEVCGERSEHAERKPHAPPEATGWAALRAVCNLHRKRRER